MGPLLSAYAYTMIALLIGGGLSTLAFGFQVASRIVMLWALFLTTAYFTHIAILFIVVVVFVFFIRQQPSETKLFYFVSLMPILPLQSYFVPFPGLNYLWDINFIRILILVLFIPMLIEYVSKPKEQKQRLLSMDIYFLAFVSLVGVMEIRTGNMTASLREMFGIAVDIALPYFVVSRYINNTQALNWLFCGFLISAVFICLFSLMESFGGWRFFTEVLFALNLKYEWLALVPYSRGGFVRAAGGPMFQPLGFAYFACLAVVVCFFFWQRKMIRLVPAGLLMGLFFLALLLTDSKGGLLAMMIGIFIIYYLRMHPSLRFVINIGAMVLIPVVFVYLISTEFSTVDSENSFSYRYELILNARHAVSQNPLFGSIHFLDDPYLQRSMQGEGIIDVVNTYLQVLLEYGFVGLFFFVMIFVSLIRRIAKKPRVIGFDHKDLLLALLGMTMFFIFTCSDVSFIPWYFMLWWAFGRGYVGFDEGYSSRQPYTVSSIQAK